MTDTPLFADPLFGLRSWRVTVDESGEWLSAPHQNTRWPPGGQWLEAKCSFGHDAPAAGCDCGVHGWHPRKRTAREVLAVRRSVAGVVEVKGAVEVHEDGFRAAEARPYALIATPQSHTALIHRLAERYGIPVVAVTGPKALLAWCRERDIGMGDEVVADLLGTGGLAERRRARFRKRAQDAARVAAAFAAGAALVFVGIHIP